MSRGSPYMDFCTDCSKYCRDLSLQPLQECFGLACGKACGSKNRFPRWAAERPPGRFRSYPSFLFKCMSINQLCNSPGINISEPQGVGLFFRF